VTRFLAIFAHPDDESLAAGGLLASRAARGDEVTVLSATWAAGTVRAGELRDAACLLGSQDVRLLGYADAAVPESAPGRPRLVDATLDEAACRLVEHLVDLAPDVVVTHDRLGGATGHPDHRRTHEVVVRALELASTLGAVPGELLLSTQPHSALPRLEPLARPGRALHTVEDAEVDEVVDVRPWLLTKLAAIAAHRSEVERGALAARVATMEPAQQAALLGTEFYARVRGTLGLRA
jgi:N-acetyl-1-D-myo-inositol-2-amino-2-deoxy-alpha-D-glucopyranoside deacetylase